MFAAGMKDIIGLEMAKERDKLEKKIEVSETNLRNARAARKENSKKDEFSWKKSYRLWDCYEDTDELECEVNFARQDLAKLNEKIKNQDVNNSDKQCNHRYQCSCSGNKSAEREVMAMKTSERLEQMALFKQEGNILHKQKKYRESLPLYEKSLIYFEYCFDGTFGERQQADVLRLHCLLNAASSFLHLKMYPLCVEYCNDALEIDNSSTKAWLRRARAHRLQDAFDAAKNDLLKAKEDLDSNSTLSSDIQREMKLLRDDERRYKEASTELAMSMVGGLNISNR